jgi:signal transduction histidine kinase
VFDQLGLEAAIEWLVKDSARRSGIEVTLEAEEFPRLPDWVASHAFRIIQEALTNVTRHSQATRVDVTVRRRGSSILFGVEDNGVGMKVKSLSGSGALGMVGMRERAVACGGTLLVTGEPGKGTAIVVQIPVPAP